MHSDLFGQCSSREKVHTLSFFSLSVFPFLPGSYGDLTAQVTCRLLGSLLQPAARLSPSRGFLSLFPTYLVWYGTFGKILILDHRTQSTEHRCTVPQYGRQEAAPKGQLSFLFSSCLSCGSDASSPQGCDSPCCCLGVETKDCIAQRSLAKAVVRCTENICHVWREGERRAHLRSQAVLPFLGRCHLLLVLTAHSHRSGSLLTLNSVQGYTSSPPRQRFSLDALVPCSAPPLSQIYHLAVTQLFKAQCVLRGYVCVCMYICSHLCACVCGGQRSTLDIVPLFLFIYSGFFFETGLPGAWNQSSSLGWLVSEPQRFTCFCFSTPALITNMGPLLQTVFFLKFGI